MKISVLRASVQTLSVIDAAVTGLLLIAVLLIGVLVPQFQGPQDLQKHQITQHTPSPSSTELTLQINQTGGHAEDGCYTYNTTDIYWWYYVQFQMYQKNLRKLGNVLDTTFCLLLFIIVVGDIVLVKGVDLTTEVRSGPKCIYYWLLCNTIVIVILPILAIFSIRIAGATGVLQDCGFGCGLPYFYITYRLLFGLMVVMYLCKLNGKLAKDPTGISVYKLLYI